MSIKKLIPHFVKEKIKSTPFIINLIDKVMHGPRKITVYNEIKGMLGADEREYLFLLAKNLKPTSTIVEIGCFAGLSSYFLGKGATISQSKIYSIDPFVHAIERQLKEGDRSWYLKKVSKKPSLQSVQATLKRYKLENTVTLIEGFGQEVARTWTRGKVDLLWIDGNHLEAYGDFKAWEKHLAEHSIIAFHDSTGPHGLPEVIRDVKRLIAENEFTHINRFGAITTIHLKIPACETVF